MSMLVQVLAGRTTGILAVIILLAFLMPPAEATNQTNIISGVTNIVSGYNLGYHDFLRIEGGGAVFDTQGLVQGGEAPPPYYPPRPTGGATAIVTDPGSVWSNQTYINVGDEYPGNSLVISNGGRVVSMFDGLVGDGGIPGIGGSNNSVVVTGTGSVWWVSNEMTIGQNGGGE